MDLDTWAPCLLQCIFCWLLGRGRKTEGQHLARPSQRVRGHGVYTHGAQVEESSHTLLLEQVGGTALTCRPSDLPKLWSQDLWDP